MRTTRIPTAFHTYNPPYYHSYAKNAGFGTEHGMVQYEITFTPELAERYRHMIARANAGGIRLRSWDFERLNEECTLFAELLNDTFSAHWGSPRFSAPQMQGFAAAMKDLGAPPDFFGFAEVQRDAVGFVFALRISIRRSTACAGNLRRTALPNSHARCKRSITGCC